MIFPPKFDLRLISSRLSRIKAKLFSAFAAPKFGSFVNYIYLCTQNQKNEVMKQAKEDPTLMTKEEFFAKIERAEKEIAEGKGVTFTNRNDMNARLNSL